MITVGMKIVHLTRNSTSAISTGKCLAYKWKMVSQATDRTGAQSHMSRGRSRKVPSRESSGPKMDAVASRFSYSLSQVARPHTATEDKTKSTISSLLEIKKAPFLPLSSQLNHINRFSRTQLS